MEAKKKMMTKFNVNNISEIVQMQTLMASTVPEVQLFFLFCVLNVPFLSSLLFFSFCKITR